MAEIRVERKSGSKAWLWVLVALIVLIVAALLLDRAGYIDLPVNLGALVTDAPVAVALLNGGYHGA